MILRLPILRFLRRRFADKKKEWREQVDLVHRNELLRLLSWADECAERLNEEERITYLRMQSCSIQ